MDLGDLVGIVGGSVATVAGVVSGALAASRLGRKVHDIHTAIMGEPARSVAGVPLPAVPPLGERVARIEAELHPNCGSSLRDAVDGAVERLDRIEARLGPDVSAGTGTR